MVTLTALAASAGVMEEASAPTGSELVEWTVTGPEPPVATNLERALSLGAQ